MALVDDVAGLRRILLQSRTIAVIGLSGNWYRPSFFAAKYMQDHALLVGLEHMHGLRGNDLPQLGDAAR